MNLPLSVSVSLLLMAFFWSIRLARRERDWRIGLLAGATGFLAIRRLLIVITGSPYIFGPGAFAELPGVIMGGATFAAIVALDRAMLERRRAEHDLKMSHQQLRELALRLDNVREKERASISHEIQDEIGQVMTGLKIEAKLFGKEVQTIHPQLFVRTQEMMALIERVMLTLRDLATELRPSVLDALGLLTAIEWQAETFQEKTGIRCSLGSNIGNEKFDSDFETAVFRIFQESLNNVHHHSEATKVKIELVKKDEKLMLTVRDNGKGFSADDLNKPNSLGVLGMRERAMRFHGIISIAGKSQAGTIVTLSLPIKSIATC
jgi:signal transduction histidine kinase